MEASHQYTPEYLAEDRGQQLVDVAVAFIVLETVFVAIFFTLRLKSRTADGPDAYLMLPAYIFCLAQAIMAIVFVHHGAGRHIVALSEAEVTAYLKTLVAMEFINPLAVTFPRLAVLFLFLRIFKTKSIRIATYVTMGVIILTWFVSFVMAWAICSPFAYNWDKTIHGSCGNLKDAFRWVSLPNIVTDVAIIVIPLRSLWKLQMGLARKIGVVVTFLMASVGIVTAILRAAAFFTIDFFADLTWYCPDIVSWTTVEPGVYLIAACLPSLVPLFKRASAPSRDRIRSSSLGSRLIRYMSWSESKGDRDVSLSPVNADRAPSSRAAENRARFEQMFGSSSEIGLSHNERWTTFFWPQDATETTDTYGGDSFDLEKGAQENDFRRSLGLP